MPVPSTMSVDKIPAARHARVRVAYARGWQALIETHAAQAAQFVREFALRAPTLAGLRLYLQVAAVPEAMQEAVWRTALMALDLDSLPAPIEPPQVHGWRRLRLDLVFDAARERKRYQARTLQLARMAGARAAEAVIATHVQNVIGFTRLVDDVLPVDQAMELYLSNFRLPQSTAHMVSQRVQAAVVGEQLLRSEKTAPTPAEWNDLPACAYPPTMEMQEPTPDPV